MGNAIQFVIEFIPGEGKMDHMKKVLTTAIETVEQKDQGALSYEFFFDEAETKLYAVERYIDADAALAHLGLVAEILPKLLEVAQVNRFQVFGNPSEGLVQALAPLGVQVLEYWNGFSR